MKSKLTPQIGLEHQISGDATRKTSFFCLQKMVEVSDFGAV
jgi:hypothetical protein